MASSSLGLEFGLNATNRWWPNRWRPEATVALTSCPARRKINEINGIAREVGDDDGISRRKSAASASLGSEIEALPPWLPREETAEGGDGFFGRRHTQWAGCEEARGHARHGKGRHDEHREGADEARKAAVISSLVWAVHQPDGGEPRLFLRPPLRPFTPTFRTAYPGKRGLGMSRPITAVLYVVLMAATVVAVDFLFLRNRFRERLLVNVGIVLLFALIYWIFLRRA